MQYPRLPRKVREEKEYQLSKEAFEAALAVEPTRTVAQMGLAQNLMAIGQLSDAAPLFEEPIKQGKNAEIDRAWQGFERL